MYQTIPRPSAAPTGHGRSVPPSKLLRFASYLLLLGVFLLFPLSLLAALARPILLPPLASSVDQTLMYLLRVFPIQVNFAEANCRVNVYTYGGSLPGPAIVVSPGDTFVLRVVNELGANNDDVLVQNVNAFHSPNTSSVHFHGMHLSPRSADNVFASISPGQTRHIRVKLHKGHPSGTFFVHPHFHGSTALQTSFAMASPLIVLDTDPNWADVPSLTLVVQLGGVGSQHFASDANKAFSSNLAASQPQTSSCVPEELVLINGLPESVFTECYGRWRVIHAATSGALLLRWRSYKCPLMEIARDGVYLTHPRSVTSVLLPPGGRVDFALSCDSEGELVSSPVDAPSWLGGGTHVMSAATIVTCRAGAGKIASLPVSLPALPSYLRDFTNSDDRVDEPRVLEWTRRGKEYGINGESFSFQPHFEVRRGEVQEWVVQNPFDESHPFHLHTNHFQVVDSSEREQVDGSWRDTVFVPAPGNITIRFVPHHFTGRSLVHCHVLQHEDLGMAWVFDIV